MVNWLSRTAGFWMPLCVLLCMVGGCTGKRYVYIPPEWNTPPPASKEPTRSGSLKPQASPPPPAVSTGPIVKPQPAFKERDLGADSTMSSGTLGKTSPVGPSAPALSPKKAEAQPPQHLASMHLVDQAKTALNQGKPDAAIPLLEQAIQVDVYNGEAFFTLARAWKMKGFRQKALEFARKAEILYQDQPARAKEVYLFQANLYKEMGDAKNAELYRQKASKL